MRNGIDNGFCFLYTHLSYRRKFLRSVWSPFVCIAITLALQLSGALPFYLERQHIPYPEAIGWVLVVFSNVTAPFFVWYAYLRWRIEERRAAKRSCNLVDRERRRAEGIGRTAASWGPMRATLCESFTDRRVVDVELPEGRHEIEYRTGMSQEQSLWVDDEEIAHVPARPWAPMRCLFEFRLGDRDAEVEVRFTSFIKSIRSFRLYIDDELVYCEPARPVDEMDDDDFRDRQSKPSPARDEGIIVTGQFRSPRT